MVEAILGVVILVAVILFFGIILEKVFTLNWFKSISKNKKEVPTKFFDKGFPCLTFDEFISLYNISPERFAIPEEYHPYTGRYFYFKSSDGKNCMFYFKTNKDEELYAEWVEEKIKKQILSFSFEHLTSTIESDIENKLLNAPKETIEILQRIKQETLTLEKYKNKI